MLASLLSVNGKSLLSQAHDEGLGKVFQVWRWQLSYWRGLGFPRWVLTQGICIAFSGHQRLRRWSTPSLWWNHWPRQHFNLMITWLQLAVQGTEVDMVPAATCLLYSTIVIMGGPGVSLAYGSNVGHEHHERAECCRTMDPDKVLCGILGPAYNHRLRDWTWHSTWHWTGFKVTLWPQSPAQTSNICPTLHCTKNSGYEHRPWLQQSHRSSLGPRLQFTSGCHHSLDYCTGYSDLQGQGGRMTFGHKYGLTLRDWLPLW